MRPFGIVCGVGLLTVLLPPYQSSWTVVAAATVVYLVIAAMLVATSRRPERSWLDPGAAYLTFFFVALVREAGGSTSGLSALLFVPILWLAITGSRRSLYVASLLAGITIMGPVLLVGEPRYPVDDWRRAFILVVIAVVLGRQADRRRVRLQPRDPRGVPAGGRDLAQGCLIGKPVPYDEFVAEFLPSGSAVVARQ